MSITALYHWSELLFNIFYVTGFSTLMLGWLVVLSGLKSSSLIFFRTFRQIPFGFDKHYLLCSLTVHLTVKASARNALMGGYGLFGGEKWTKLYGGRRWPKRNSRVGQPIEQIYSCTFYFYR